jgi:hypothetical protein
MGYNVQGSSFIFGRSDEACQIKRRPLPPLGSRRQRGISHAGGSFTAPKVCFTYYSAAATSASLRASCLMNRLPTVSCARSWNGRARIGLICYALASAACQQRPSPAVTPAAPAPCPPPGSRIVDEIALFTQCLGASLKTPPGIQGSNQ